MADGPSKGGPVVRRTETTVTSTGDRRDGPSSTAMEDRGVVSGDGSGGSSLPDSGGPGDGGPPHLFWLRGSGWVDEGGV